MKWSDFGTKIQPPIATTLNAVIERNWKFRCWNNKLLCALPYVQELHARRIVVPFLTVPCACSHYSLSSVPAIPPHLSLGSDHP